MEAGAGRHEASREVSLPTPTPSRAAAYNDHFTCPIFLLAHELVLLFFSSSFHGRLGSSPPSPTKSPTYMDARKKLPPATASGAAPANGYFSTVFSASPTANGNDAKQTDLYAMLNKQNSKGQNGGGFADGKSHSPTKARGAYKDGKQSYPNESSESPYFGSSVHYGAREFYGNTPPKQGDASPGNQKEQNPDGSLATRGDWWQGHNDSQP
uniref:Uncharacterized protein n=1 Tax=Oryza punctata TaxID=4537 RepID=A0A0E0L3A1_ORYPU